MKRKYIIKSKREIDSLFKSKDKRGNSYFVVVNKKNYENVNFRFAMSIGTKYGNAVNRNKIKRQVRSIIRENQHYIDKTNNFVIVIRPQSNKLQYNEISSHLTNLLKKMKIMEINNEKN